MSDSIKKYEELKEEGKLGKSPDPETLKRYAILVSSMSLDYTIGKISSDTYLNNLTLIVDKITQLKS